MVHVVMVGNPGCGKSTLLNTLIGERIFSSGLSVGTGRTKKMQTVERGNIKYSDTPGLADVDRRVEAAEEITKALSKDDEIKLIYVLKLDSARLRTEDIGTLKLILSSFERDDIETAYKYTIVVNMLSPFLLEQIAGIFGNSKVKFIEEYFKDISPPKDIHLVKMDISAYDRPNCILTNSAYELRGFVERSPVIVSKGGVTIELKKYPQILVRATEVAKKIKEKVPFCRIM